MSTMTPEARTRRIALQLARIVETAARLEKNSLRSSSSLSHELLLQDIDTMGQHTFGLRVLLVEQEAERRAAEVKA